MDIRKKAIGYLMAAALLSGCSAATTQHTAIQSGAAINQSATKSSYYNYTKAEILKEKGKLNQALMYMKRALELDPGSLFLQKEIIALHLLLKDEKTAMAAAETLVAQNPDDVDSLMILAKLKQMMKLDEEARNIYQKILQLKPDSQDIYLILGRHYMEGGNLDEAFRLYTKMSEHFPEAYAAHFYLGKIHAEKANYDYAEKEFLKTLELNPTLVEPRFELIGLYQDQERSMNRPDPKILKLYDEISEIEPHNFRVSLELPLYYYHHGGEKKAAELMAETGEKIVKAPRLIMLAAKELFGEERYNDAAILFSGMLKGAPGSSAMHYLAAIAYDSLKQGDKAIEHFVEVGPESEHYKKSIIHLAFLYGEYKSREKAIAFLEEKCSELPEDIDLIMYLASFYEDEKRFEDAIAVLNKGIAISPATASLHFRLGIIQDKIGLKEACIRSMERVIELEPENASALNYLGYTYADRGERLDEAEVLIKKALEIKPDDGFITDSLGWVYFKRGDYENAITLLEKAVELSGGDPVIIEHLGDAYSKTGRMADALKTYELALSKTKEDNPGLTEKISELKKTLEKN